MLEQEVQSRAQEMENSQQRCTLESTLVRLRFFLEDDVGNDRHVLQWHCLFLTEKLGSEEMGPSTDGSSRGPGFSSLHPHGGWHRV